MQINFRLLNSILIRHLRAYFDSIKLIIKRNDMILIVMLGLQSDRSHLRVCNISHQRNPNIQLISEWIRSTFYISIDQIIRLHFPIVLLPFTPRWVYLFVDLAVVLQRCIHLDFSSVFHLIRLLLSTCSRS